MWRDVRIGIMKAVPENIRLSKNLFHQIPWSRVPQFTLNSLEGIEVSCSTIGFILPRGRSQTPLLFSSVQLLSRVWLFATRLITARQASLSITDSRSSLRFTSIESGMPSSHLILCRPLLLLPPISPSIRVFSNESTLHVRCEVLEFQYRSLVSLPFLKPAWTSGSSRFTYCWSLAWRILSIALLACQKKKKPLK